MCLYPKLIMNPKYKKNKKNGGNVPPVTDPRVLQVPIGCTRCMECKRQKAREWQVRLHEEIRTKEQAHFVTLTFSNEELAKLEHEINITQDEPITGYALDNEIATLAVRRFLERWRKKHKKSVKHWMVTELGHNGTENIHIHGILWTKEKEDITNIWSYGYAYTGSYVNEATVNYIIKYVMKMDMKHKEYVPKILTSPGIGKGYMKRGDSKANQYKEGTLSTREYYTTRQGYKLSLPIYYRNKIYTDEEREKLWIEKLNKQIRYVLGREIDVSKSNENYIKSLHNAQGINDRLGYGSDRKNWNQIEYENQLREQKTQQRIQAWKNKQERKKKREQRKLEKLANRGHGKRRKLEPWELF